MDFFDFEYRKKGHFLSMLSRLSTPVTTPAGTGFGTNFPVCIWRLNSIVTRTNTFGTCFRCKYRCMPVPAGVVTDIVTGSIMAKPYSLPKILSPWICSKFFVLQHGHDFFLTSKVLEAVRGQKNYSKGTLRHVTSMFGLSHSSICPILEPRPMVLISSLK